MNSLSWLLGFSRSTRESKAAAVLSDRNFISWSTIKYIGNILWALVAETDLNTREHETYMRAKHAQIPIRLTSRYFGVAV